MTTTSPGQPEATLAQIASLAEAGCEIARVAVPNEGCLPGLRAVASHSPLPVVADVHFSGALGVAAAEAGVQCVRINPGTLGSRQALETVGRACAAAAIPIRVGVNAGSLAPALAEEYGAATPRALVESAKRTCGILEAVGLSAIKVSLKTSDVVRTVQACRLFAAETEYPLHLGITEAGTQLACTVKSAIGIGGLLLDGIGDTIRVSLTGEVVEEVHIARRILEAVGCRRFTPEIVSCPTCGRSEIDVVDTVRRVENTLAEWEREGKVPNVRKIAVMGCAVNGPGEARDADVGIAGGRGRGALFVHGTVRGTFPEESLVSALVDRLRPCLVPLDCYSGDALSGRCSEE